MSQIIKIKSGTSGQPDSLARGELAINVSNGAFYYGDAQSATTGTWFFSGASAETFSATTTVIDTQLNISGNTFFEGALSGTGAITTVGSISTDGDLTGDNALIRDNIQHVGDTTTEISFGNGGGEIDFRTNNGSRIDLTNSGVRLGGANSRVTTILDEDNMSSDSDTSLATQQSIKAYVDSQVATSDTLQEVTDNGATTTNALQFGSNLGISGDTFFEGTLSGTGSVTAVGNITTDGDVTTDNVLVRDNIQHVGDTTNEISFATNTQDFRTNNTSRLDISNSGVRLGGANSRVTTILDEDAMGTNSATALATQQSIKAYADTKLPLAGGTMSGNVDFGDNDITNVDSLDADKFSIAGGTEMTGILDEDNMASDSNVKLATQQSIKAYSDTKLPLAGGTMSGNVDFGDNDITNVDSFDADKLSIAGGTEMTSIKDEDNMASDSATALATQQSIKAYSDTKLPLAGGTMSGNVDFGDNDITNVDSLDADKFSIAGGTEMTSIKDEDNMASDSNVALATQQSIKAYVDSQVATSDTLQEVTDNGATTTNAIQLGSNLGISGNTFFEGSISGTSDIQISDAGKLKLGDSGDLEIYHNGSNSIIGDTGVGTLFYRSGTQTFQNAGASKTMAVFNGANSVDLYYNNSQKFETTGTGILVTGDGKATTLTSTSNLYVTGNTFYEGALSGTGNINTTKDLYVSGNTFIDGSKIDVKDDLKIQTTGQDYPYIHFNADTIDVLSAPGETISLGENVAVATNLSVGANIQHIGDTTNEISFASATQDFRTNNSSRLDISNSGVRLGGTGARVTSITDSDSLGTSDTVLCTQGNVKAYADTKLPLAGGTMSGNVDFGDNDITNVDSFDADKFSIAGGTEMTSIKDEDNMASDSATALATQQSIKAYVDANAGGSPTLQDVTTNGATSNVAITLSNTLTVGTNGTGHDVKFFGDTSGQYMLWDQSADELALVGDTKLSFHDAAGGENIVASSDGHLEINAGTTLDITAPTVQINASTLIDINGDADISGSLKFGATDTSTNSTHYCLFKVNGATNVVNRTNGYAFNPSTDTLTLGGVIGLQGQAGTIASNSGDLTLDSAADIVIDAAGGNIEFKDAGTLALTIDIDSTAGDAIFKDAGSAEIFRIDGSANSLLMASGKKIEFGDSGESIVGDGTDLTIASGADILLNPTGEVGIGITTPITKLDVHHDPTGIASNTGGGEVLIGVGSFGEGIAQGMLVYLSASGVWTPADADAEVSSSYLLGITLSSSIEGGVLIRGFYNLFADYLQGTFRPGSPCYISESAGSVDFTPPSASGDFVRIVGHATDTANVIYFNPSNDYIEIA